MNNIKEFGTAKVVPVSFLGSLDGKRLRTGVDFLSIFGYNIDSHKEKKGESKMLNFYSQVKKLYRNGEEIDFEWGQCLREESEAQPIEKELTWDNFREVINSPGFHVPIHWWKTKKGIKITFAFGNNPFSRKTRAIKQWKHEELGLKITIDYIPIKGTLHDLFKYYAPDVVFRYLKERGINNAEKLFE